MNFFEQHRRWFSFALSSALALLSACDHASSIKTPSEVTLLVNLVPTPTPPPKPTPLPTLSPPPSPVPPTPIPTSPLPTPTTPNVAAGLTRCTVDVGRTAQTAHPVSQLNEYVKGLNDEVRAITGLPIDLFVGEGGEKYVIECMLPPSVAKGAVLDANTGDAIARLHQMRGMPLRNYLAREDMLRPGVDEVLKKPLQLVPVVGKNPGKAAIDFNTTLPPPSFDFNLPQQALPDLNITVGSGEYRYSPVGDTEVLKVTMRYVAKSGKAADATTDDLKVVMQGTMGPDACAWATDSCPPEKRVPNIQDRHIDPHADVIEPLRQIVDARKAQGIPISANIFEELFVQSAHAQTAPLALPTAPLATLVNGAVFDELFTTTAWDTSGWEHVQFRVEGASAHLIATNVFMKAEGGFSCALDRPESAAGWRANAWLAALSALGVGLLLRVRRSLQSKSASQRVARATP